MVRKKRGAPVTSPGFVIHTRELWDGGPSGLSVFGMSGSITYGFAHLIEHRLPVELLCNDAGFIYCEISSEKPLIPANEPSDAGFTDDWTVTLYRLGHSPVVCGPGQRLTGLERSTAPQGPADDRPTPAATVA